MSDSPEDRKARHTPGPWRWGEFCNRQGGKVKELVGAEPADEIILECGCLDEANARLIAAAPEMLAALKEEFGILSQVDWRWASEDEKLDLDKRLRRIQSAIAKAEGE